VGPAPTALTCGPAGLQPAGFASDTKPGRDSTGVHMTDGYGSGQPPQSWPPPPIAYPSVPPPGASGPFPSEGGWAYQGPPQYHQGYQGGIPNQRRLAGYGSRLGAWLIDWLILGIVVLPILVVTHSIHHTHSTVIVNGLVSQQSGYHVSFPGAALQVVITLAYGSLLCGSKGGQTLGMMLVGTRAVDIANCGPIGFPRALGRAAFEYLMAFLLFVPWIIDMLFPIWDPQNQTLHDKVSRTVVVKV
jgi:uncharacterized RDD family membrane protein YckC